MTRFHKDFHYLLVFAFLSVLRRNNVLQTPTLYFQKWQQEHPWITMVMHSVRFRTEGLGYIRTVIEGHNEGEKKCILPSLTIQMQALFRREESYVSTLPPGS